MQDVNVTTLIWDILLFFLNLFIFCVIGWTRLLSSWSQSSQISRVPTQTFEDWSWLCTGRVTRFRSYQFWVLEFSWFLFLQMMPEIAVLSFISVMTYFSSVLNMKRNWVYAIDTSLTLHIPCLLSYFFSSFLCLVNFINSIFSYPV